MGETCIHVPPKVFGFESTTCVSGQPQRSPSQLRGTSLLTNLLKEGSRPPLQSAFMDNSDAYSEDDDEMMEAEAVVEEEEEEVWEASAAGGSAPMPIPSTSESFLRQQREALKRFVYAHQIDEMRKQCAAYFARQARFNEVPDAAFDTSIATPAVPLEGGGLSLTVPEPTTTRRRKPGF